MESLEEMRERHRLIARYSVLVAASGMEVVLFTGMEYKLASQLSEILQGEWVDSLPGKFARFCTPVHLIRLENAEECLTPEAKARRLLVAPRKKVS